MALFNKGVGCIDMRLSVPNLMDLCLEYVGSHAHHYSVTCFAELPTTLLEQLLPNFAASELHRMHGVVVAAGVQVNILWKKLKEKRWSPSFENFSTLLDLEDDSTQDVDYHQKYMEKHFHDVLRYIGYSGEIDPRETFKLNHIHTVDKKHCLARSADTTEESPLISQLLPDLLSQSQYVQRLSLSFKECTYIQQRDLFAALQVTVKHLDVYSLIEPYFDMVVQVIEGLLQAGQLRVLTLFYPHFLGCHLEDLLYKCAGHRESVQQTETTVDTTESRNGFITSEEPLDWVSEPIAPCDTATGVIDDDDDDELYDEALKSDTATPFGAFDGPSLEALGLVDPKQPMYESLNQALVQVLLKWPSLHKLALTKCDISMDVQRAIFKKTRQAYGQLRYLVLEDCHLAQSPLQTLTEMAALDKLKPPALENLTLGLYYAPVNVADNMVLQLPKLLASGNLGAKRLTLRETAFVLESPNGFEAVRMWLLHDKALKCLTFHDVDLPGPYGAQLFQALRGTHIETLTLSELSMQPEWISEVLPFLQDSPNLRSLTLQFSWPSPQSNQLFASAEFANAIVGHPSLEKLDLSGNRLGVYGTQLLLKVFLKCMTDQLPAQLKLLNLASTSLEGKDLLEVGQQIHRQCKEGSLQGALLQHLVLSGNAVRMLHQELFCLYRALVSELDMERHDYIMPMADFLAQM